MITITLASFFLFLFAFWPWFKNWIFILGAAVAAVAAWSCCWLLVCRLKRAKKATQPLVVAELHRPKNFTFLL